MPNTSLLDLPHDLILKILGFVSSHDIKNLTLANHYLHNVSSSIAKDYAQRAKNLLERYPDFSKDLMSYFGRSLYPIQGKVILKEFPNEISQLERFLSGPDQQGQRKLLEKIKAKIPVLFDEEEINNLKSQLQMVYVIEHKKQHQLDLERVSKSAHSDESYLRMRAKHNADISRSNAEIDEKLKKAIANAISGDLPELVGKAVLNLDQQSLICFKKWLRTKGEQCDVKTSEKKPPLVLSPEESFPLIAEIKTLRSFSDSWYSTQLYQFLKKPEKAFLTESIRQFHLDILAIATVYGSNDCIDFVFKNDHFSRDDLKNAVLNASIFGKEKFLKYVKDHITDAKNFLKTVITWNKRSLLRCALDAIPRSYNSLKVLVEGIEDPSSSLLDVQDEDGNTALMVAARLGDLTAVKILFRDNSNYLRKLNKLGFHAFRLAIVSGNVELIRFLKPYYQWSIEATYFTGLDDIQLIVGLKQWSYALANFTLEDLRQLKAIPEAQWENNSTLYDRVQTLNGTSLNGVWDIPFYFFQVEFFRILLEKNQLDFIAKKLVISPVEEKKNDACIQELLPSNTGMSRVASCLPHIRGAIEKGLSWFVAWFFTTTMFTAQEKLFVYAVLYKENKISIELSDKIFQYRPHFIDVTQMKEALLQAEKDNDKNVFRNFSILLKSCLDASIAEQDKKTYSDSLAKIFDEIIVHAHVCKNFYQYIVEILRTQFVERIKF